MEGVFEGRLNTEGETAIVAADAGGGGGAVDADIGGLYVASGVAAAAANEVAIIAVTDEQN